MKLEHFLLIPIFFVTLYYFFRQFVSKIETDCWDTTRSLYIDLIMGLIGGYIGVAIFLVVLFLCIGNVS